MSSQYDVVAVGNAIIDLIQPVTDGFLAEEGIAKDAMTLIDEARADHLTARLSEAIVAAGGSAANTMTGIASFGGKAGYIGKVADDALGARFREEFRAAGVAFDTPARSAPPGTARSIIAVTPDGHRSMNTYLGASTLLNPEDIDAELIRAGETLFLEGYLFDRDEAKVDNRRRSGSCVPGAPWPRAAPLISTTSRAPASTRSQASAKVLHSDSRPTSR